MHANGAGPMSILSRTFVFAALAFLAACTTITPEERRARDEAECTSFGFRKKTDAFADCLLRLELDRRADRRAATAELRSMSDPFVIYQPVYVEPRPRPPR